MNSPSPSTLHFVSSILIPLRLLAAALMLVGFTFSSGETIWADQSITPKATNLALVTTVPPASATVPLRPNVAAATAETAAAVQAIRLPENWQISLFAAEPDVANVVAFDIDNQGRLFACETFRQGRGVTDNRSHDEKWLLADLASKTVQDRIDYHRRLLGDAAIAYAQHDDRIRMLVDTTGDGKADQSHVYANGFHRLEEGTGAGVLARGNDVYYSCIPRLWKLSDTEQDGKADVSSVLSDGYGVRVAFQGHDLHGLIIGVDGRLYFSIGDRGYFVTSKEGNVLADPESGAVFRCELDGSNLEVFATGLRNPQELAFNDVGDWFTVDNNGDSGEKARIIELLRYADYGWRMHYQYLPTRGPFNEDRLWELQSPDQPSYVVPSIANYTEGPGGLVFYPGTGFGEELNNQFLICDFRGSSESSGIRSFKLKSKGASYQLLSTSDPVGSVSATDVAFGPDGALYVSDWAAGREGVGKGRIYRITNPEQQNDPLVAEVAELLKNGFKEQTVATLVRLLSHRDRRIRLESQWELANRRESESLIKVATTLPVEAPEPQATGVAEPPPTPPKSETPDLPTLARLHAIWGCEMIARRQPEMAAPILKSLRPLLVDSDSRIRTAVAKLMGDRGDTASEARLIELLDDRSARVRYAAIMALANQKAAAALPAVLRVIRQNNQTDAAIRHAGQVYLTRAAPASVLASLHRDESEAVRLSGVVALRNQKSGEIQAYLNDESLRVVGEAARGIHDQPIPLALQPLAALIDSPTAGEGLIRRVLNANYRLGAAESAVKLAKFASRNSSPASMRIFALDCLGDWGQSDRRDRVLGNLQPAVLRNRADAAAALAPEIVALMNSPEAIREKTITVAAKLGLQQVTPQLVMRVKDVNLKPSDRGAALLALTRLDSGAATEIAREIRLAPATELVETALRVLAAQEREANVETFISATESRRLGVQQLAWDTLADTEDPRARTAIAAAVESYLDGNLNANLHLNVLEAADGKLDAPLMMRLERHTTAKLETDPLANWMPSAAGGDAATGKKLFFERTDLSCVRCHKVEQSGGEIGPNLSLIGMQKDHRYLLESLCLPNATIAAGFDSVVITDDAGQTFTGIVRSANEGVLELIQADGSVVRMEQTRIVEKQTGPSLMPADLITNLTPRELRDLVAYLASLQTQEPASPAESNAENPLLGHGK